MPVFAIVGIGSEIWGDRLSGIWGDRRLRVSRRIVLLGEKSLFPEPLRKAIGRKLVPLESHGTLGFGYNNLYLVLEKTFMPEVTRFYGIIIKIF
ncbi:MAG: hypothetical protein ACRC8Y_02520 [Chroococcales cyanobacterium]